MGAGLLGIGGGMIVSPLLLELGLHPQVAAATSSLMVLFSASSAALSFAFDHLLNIDYALIYGLGARPLSWGLRLCVRVADLHDELSYLGVFHDYETTNDISQASGHYCTPLWYATTQVAMYISLRPRTVEADGSTPLHPAGDDCTVV